MAINAGDVMSMLALQPLLDNRARLGPFLSMRILEETERMARESAEGQALELGWRRDNVVDVREADYLEMVLKKTCWLLAIHPTRVGALIATNGSIDLERFIRFGFFLGAAFQIQDDVLNLEGDAEAYGKELGGDLYEGKRTLILIRLFEQGDDGERARLRRLLGTPREERDAAEIAWVRARVDAYDCIEYARKVAHGLAGAARHEFAQAFSGVPDSRDKRFIEALPHWVLQRS
jgi:geranylgeranyl diphosphate synthase type II